MTIILWRHFTLYIKKLLQRHFTVSAAAKRCGIERGWQTASKLNTHKIQTKHTKRQAIKCLFSCTCFRKKRHTLCLHSVHVIREGFRRWKPARVTWPLGLCKSKVKYTAIAVRSLTWHIATGTHMPYKIIQCYLPPDRGDVPAFTPAEAGTRLSDPGGMQGWVELVGWLHTEMVYPPENGHPPRY